jgi:3-phosphoshikimate 1-carboxyvinyltransferase
MTRLFGRGPLRGTLQVPGDKSVSHRALILATLARGESTITGLSAGLDVRHTRTIMGQLGGQITEASDSVGAHRVGTLTVLGGDLGQPSDVLDVGNSGTGARLLAGVCAGQPFRSTITGDESIASRPMDRVVEPLRAMGATIDGRDGGRFTPLTIVGGGLVGIDYSPPMASAQVKSAILLAGLFADGPTTVRESVVTRQHTEEMLNEHGVSVTTETRDDVSVVTLHPGAITAGHFDVPGDPSQAAFWICAAAAIPGSDVTVENVYLSPERSGFLDILAAMGADLAVDRAAGRVRARGGELRGVSVSGGQLPDLIDEVPALAVAGALAVEGSLVFEDATELRTKESDRIDTVVEMLSALGGEVEAGPDWLAVSARGALRGGRVRSHHDHRIAMAAAVATSGMNEADTVEVDDFDCVATSYPGFLDDLATLTTPPAHSTTRRVSR